MPESLILGPEEAELIKQRSSEAIFDYFLEQSYLDAEKQIVNIVMLFVKLFCFFNKVALSDDFYTTLSRKERSYFSEKLRQFIVTKIESTAKRLQDEVLFETSHASVRRLVKNEDADFWQVIYCLGIYKQCDLTDSNLNMEIIDWFIRARLPQPSTFAGWAPFKSACLPYKSYARLLLFHDTQRQQFKSNLFTRAYSAFIESLYIASLQQLKQLSHQLIEQREENLTREAQVARELESVMVAISGVLYDNLDKTTANIINAAIFTHFKTLRNKLELHPVSFDVDVSLAQDLKNYVTQLIDSMGAVDSVRRTYQAEVEVEESQDMVARMLC